MSWLIIGVAAVGLALVFSAQVPVVDDLLATITGRGSRVGPVTAVDSYGVIREDPRALAGAAGLDLDTYALARMLSSEEGRSASAYKVGVAFAAVNASGGSPADKLLAGRGDTAGRFARQNARYQSGATTLHAGKYASTALDPRADDVTIAGAVLGGQLADPTHGATNYFRPGLQDSLFDDGAVAKTAADVDAAWRAAGLVRVAVAGVGSDLAFYSPRGQG